MNSFAASRSAASSSPRMDVPPARSAAVRCCGVFGIGSSGGGRGTRQLPSPSCPKIAQQTRHLHDSPAVWTTPRQSRRRNEVVASPRRTTRTVWSSVQGNGVDRATADPHPQGDIPLRKTPFSQHSPDLLNHGCRNHCLPLPKLPVSRFRFRLVLPSKTLKGHGGFVTGATPPQTIA